MAEGITDRVKRQIAQDSQMSAFGVNQLLEGKPITSASDRQALAGHMYYLYGKLASCPLPPPRSRTNLH